MLAMVIWPAVMIFRGGILGAIICTVTVIKRIPLRTVLGIIMILLVGCCRTRYRREVRLGFHDEYEEQGECRLTYSWNILVGHPNRLARCDMESQVEASLDESSSALRNVVI